MSIQRPLFRLIILIFLCFAFLSACGGGSSNSSGVKIDDVIDNIPPSVKIEFPPPVSMTEGNRILIRGTAFDELSSISSIQINGVDVSDTSVDGSFSTWSANVDLVDGENTITVSASDSQSNSSDNAALVQVKKDTLLGNFPNSISLMAQPQALAIDRINFQLFVGDGTTDSIYAIDLSSGERSIFSDSSTEDVSKPFLQPEGLFIDESNNTLWVSDREESAIFAVDLTTGERSLASNNSIPNSTTPFLHPKELLISATNTSEILVLDNGNGIVAMDTVTGSRRVFSNNLTPNGLNPFGELSGIIYDSSNHRYIVGGSQTSLMTIDDQTGARELLSSSIIPNVNEPLISNLQTLTLDAERNRVLIVSRSEEQRSKLISVDLDSGERTLFSDETKPNNLNLFSGLTEVIYDESMGFALVADSEQGAILAIDIITGERVFLSRGQSATNTGVGCDCDLSEYDRCIGNQIVQRRENGLIESTIVYNFEEPVYCGTFYNGYDYMVAPTTTNGVVILSSVTPEVIGVGATLRHGLTINPSSSSQSNLDGRLGSSSSTELLPLSIDTSAQAISSILKTESWNVDGGCNERIGDYGRMCFEHIDVLTVLNEWPVGGSKEYFRPAFWGNSKVLRPLSSVDLSMLPNIPVQSRPSGIITHDHSIEEALAYMDGIKVDFMLNYPAIQTLKGYSNWPGVTNGYSPNGWGKFWDHAQWIYLDTESAGITRKQKEDLAYRIIEHGFDALEIVLNYPTYGPWVPNGGHSPGRYGVALLAAVLQKGGADLEALNSEIATQGGTHIFSETGQITQGDGYAIYGPVNEVGGNSYSDCNIRLNSISADSKGKTDIHDYNYPEGGNCVYSHSQVYQDVIWPVWFSQAMVISAIPSAKASADSEFLDYVNRLATTGTKSYANQDPSMAVVDVFALGKCNGGLNDGLLAYVKSECPGGVLTNPIAPNFVNQAYSSKFGAFMFEQLQSCLISSTCPGM